MSPGAAGSGRAPDRCRLGQRAADPMSPGAAGRAGPATRQAPRAMGRQRGSRGADRLGRARAGDRQGRARAGDRQGRAAGRGSGITHRGSRIADRGAGSRGSRATRHRTCVRRKQAAGRGLFNRIMGRGTKKPPRGAGAGAGQGQGQGQGQDRPCPIDMIKRRAPVRLCAMRLG